MRRFATMQRPSVDAKRKQNDYQQRLVTRMRNTHVRQKKGISRSERRWHENIEKTCLKQDKRRT